MTPFKQLYIFCYIGFNMECYFLSNKNYYCYWGSKEKNQTKTKSELHIHPCIHVAIQCILYITDSEKNFKSIQWKKNPTQSFCNQTRGFLSEMSLVLSERLALIMLPSSGNETSTRKQPNSESTKDPSAPTWSYK